ncbi:MAG: HlyD family efflux transporter periplasmic adaptor subunit [Candidatus Deferrimicrobiaceae bacterium]
MTVPALPRKAFLIAGPLAVFCLLALPAGCGRPASDRVQGYVEGEFLYISSPYPGQLASLHVERGAQVKAGDPLYALESVPEKPARDEAARRLAQARASLADLKKGRRPTELASMEEQLEGARASLVLSEKELSRQQTLFRTGAVPQQAVDRARSAHDQDRHRVAQLESDLKTARLSARPDQVDASEANVRALEAALTRAEWDLSQKRQAAPQTGRVFDTLYRPGEWVPAGRPVVVLLPPQNIKVRAFVPQARIGTVHLGDPVLVAVDGVGEPFRGRVSFISPRAEYTPPVIYSRESRAKLVFLIEAVFDPETAARLHPGQPVDVRFGS